MSLHDRGPLPLNKWDIQMAGPLFKQSMSMLHCLNKKKMGFQNVIPNSVKGHRVPGVSTASNQALQELNRCVKLASGVQ